MKFLRLLLGCLAGGGVGALAADRERVYLDPAGVVRWSAGDGEVALFGANYCLPSSSDYRAAGYLGVERKRLIEQDVAHFARMGWDGLRLVLWGDWENCDREGNLIQNEHLDLMDYLIHCAKQRGISMLFTPIHRHSALWPDGKDGDHIRGFSKFYRPAELGTNPAAIAAQQNYLRQILAHVNPYTGTALKDEPAIVFIELINEPHHHANDIPGSIRYIDALVDAVRSTGCQKLLFHNLTQDFRILPAITGSKAQGLTIGWYPTALVAGRTLTENYLRWVDDYTPLRRDLPAMPRLVYEFDSADMLAGYMYPAMVRAYREIGVQFATMFAYDMLATAPYNLGWQTHYLNLVYSPTKAVSAVIAAEAMRRLPRGKDYGRYPGNRTFGDFRVSYEENLSELVTPEAFLHANDTTTAPPTPARLRRIVGVGRSPVVEYAGLGSYFLDRIDAGRWRLEVYPDAVFTQDPFAQRLNHQTPSARLVWRTRPMRLELPDLGPAFSVRPLNAGNTHQADATGGTFAIRPGVYLLTRAGADSTAALPAQVGRVGLAEFVCPPEAAGATQVIPRLQAEYPAEQPWPVTVDVIATAAPLKAVLQVRGGGRSLDLPLTPGKGLAYTAEVPARASAPGTVAFSVTLEDGQGRQVYPDTATSSWNAAVAGPTQPLSLFEAGRDGRRLFSLRESGDRRLGYFEILAVTDSAPAALRLSCPPAGSTANHTVSLQIKTPVRARGAALAGAKALRLQARGSGRIAVALVEADGTAWRGEARVGGAWAAIDLPLAQLQPASATKLPLGYPGNWNRDLHPAEGRGGAGDRLQLPQAEHLQLTALATDERTPRSISPASNSSSNNPDRVFRANLGFIHDRQDFSYAGRLTARRPCPAFPNP